MRELKIVTVGDGAVGKTSLLTVLKGLPFPERYVPTIFENYSQEVKVERETIDFHIWDTAGQSEYDRLRPLSYINANVILLCFALDSRTTFLNLSEKWLGEVMHYVPEAKIIVVGTKSDLRNAENPDHVSDRDVEKFMGENNCFAYISCSAKTSDGVDKIFSTAAKAVPGKKNRVCNLL